MNQIVENLPLENLLTAARQLPLDLRRRFAQQLLAETDHTETPLNTEQTASLKIVDELYGSIKGLDRETIKWLAEDEELCGY